MASMIDSRCFGTPQKVWNLEEDSFAIRSRLITPPILRSVQSSQENIQSKASGNLTNLQEGLQSVTSSLALLSETIGNALAESFTFANCRNGYASPQVSYQQSEEHSDCVTSNSSQKATGSPESVDSPTVEHLKPSRDLAKAMTSKAKRLLRELQMVKAELAFMRDRSAQLEEENRKLRNSVDKGAALDEEDLVRRQLETLLAEKARLVQENATFKRENQFLHEAIEYHQLTVQRMTLPDESLHVL